MSLTQHEIRLLLRDYAERLADAYTQQGGISTKLIMEIVSRINELAILLDRK